MEEKEKNGGHGHGRGKKQRHFNPGHTINKKRAARQGSFKELCLRLIHFINRGSKFTAHQIDELIFALHRGILMLQKKKQELFRGRK